MFTSEKALEYLLSEEKTFGQKIMSRLFGFTQYFSDTADVAKEGRRFIREYKKLFDKLSSANYGANGGTRYALAENAKKDVETALKSKFSRAEVKLTDSSPSIITEQKGVRNLPLMMNASHIRENVFTENEARERGLSVDEHTHYHGLGEPLFLNVINELDNVKLAYRGTSNATDTSRRENYFLLISEQKDSVGNTINVPVIINETAQYNSVFIKINKVATVFGRDNFNDYIQNEVKNGNLVRIKKRSTSSVNGSALIAAGYGENTSNTKITQNAPVVNSILRESAENYTANAKKVDDGTRRALNSEAAEMSDSGIRYALRKDPPPKKTINGYKVFVVKDGKLYPPMVANPNAQDTPVGVWLDADVGTRAPDSKTGRMQVKAGGKGTQGGFGSLAFRPGWHLGETPLAKQFDRTNPVNGKKELFPKNFVWALCEIAADADYQDEAMSYGYTKNGKFQHSLAGLPKLPKDGYYRYRTNPNPDTVPWLITGAMKVKQILSDVEVNEILKEKGIEPKQRLGGNKTLAELGLSKYDGVRFALGEKSTADGKKRYSYNELVKNKDMAVIGLNVNVPTDADGHINRAAVIARGRLNARAQYNPNNTEKDTYVYIPAISKDIIVGTKGLQYGLTHGDVATAKVVMKIGDVLINSIAINELDGSTVRNTDMSYILLGICSDTTDDYAVRIVIDKASCTLEELNAYSLKAVKGKMATKKSHNSVLKYGAAAGNNSRISSGSVISIRDYLDFVKDIPLINEVFSEDVANVLGVTRTKTACMLSEQLSTKIQTPFRQ